MKIVYLIRHSAPFVMIDNYDDYQNVSWDDYNRNMILSSLEKEYINIRDITVTSLDEVDNSYNYYKDFVDYFYK